MGWSDEISDRQRFDFHFYFHGGRERGQILAFTCWILFNIILAIITLNELLGDIWFMNNDYIFNILEWQVINRMKQSE